MNSDNLIKIKTKLNILQFLVIFKIFKFIEANNNFITSNFEFRKPYLLYFKHMEK